MVVKIDRPRYLLVEFSGKLPNEREIIRNLRNKVTYLAGQIFLASSNLHLIGITENYAIIRANHNSRDVIEAAIQLLDFDDTIPVIRTVSGTIKTVNEKLSSNFEDLDI